jgi:hypothetical protein
MSYEEEDTCYVCSKAYYEEEDTCHMRRRIHVMCVVRHIICMQ